MGVQSLSTLATDATGVSRVGIQRVFAHEKHDFAVPMI